MGRIGERIAKRLAAFEVPIVYHSRNRRAEVPWRHYSDLLAMAKDVDTLLAIVPGGPATKGLIGADVFAALGPKGIFVNVARGSVVDEPALIEALRSGTILAAVTPVPDTLSEYQFAGLLRGAKLDLVPAKTVPLLVPAQAEMVLEGYVHLDDLVELYVLALERAPAGTMLHGVTTRSPLGI